MFDRELTNKIDDIIKEKFPIIYDYNFDGLVLLYGGAIKNIIMNKSIHDFDFVILSQEKCQIMDFIRKYRLRHSMNAGGGYKIFYNNYTIDIATYNDLLDTGIYDIDLLFYDINKHMIISCGAINSIKTRTITEINDERNPLYSNKLRLKKLISFVKYTSKSNKKVKVKQNKIRWEIKMLKRRIKVYINKIFYGNFRKCFRFLYNCKKEFFLILVLGVLMVLISMINPLLSSKIITGILNGSSKMVLFIVLIVLLLNVISVIISYFFSKLYLIIRKKMAFNIRKDIINCVLDFELNDFNNNNRGVFIDKLSHDPNEITRIFNSIKDLLVRGIGNFLVIVYIFYLNYIVGFVLLVFMFIIFKIRMVGIRKKRKYRKAYYDEQEKYTSVLGEMINGINEIKGLDLRNNYLKVAEDSFESVSKNEFNGSYYQKIYNKIATFVQFIASGVVLILGLFLVDKGMLDSSELIVIYMYNTYVFTYLERFVLLISYSFDLDVSCDRIFSLLDGNMYSKETYGNKYKEKCIGEIEFNDVKFRYNYKNNYVLDNCSSCIKSNETVAIVGESGSGKTTILNLIARLYKVDDGCIKIDGEDIGNYSEKFIKENISIISQSPYLFDMSIKENLRLVKEDITDEEMLDVCRLVCLDEFINTLPNGYDTIIGEGGIKLSGGQKQRLGIARALIKNTKIILLDEITSALDNNTGTIIKKVIKNIQKDRTVIIVTHELSMIKDCSRILVLDNGKIVGDGKHSELLNNNDIYKKLYKIK